MPRNLTGRNRLPQTRSRRPHRACRLESFTLDRSIAKQASIFNFVCFLKTFYSIKKIIIGFSSIPYNSNTVDNKIGSNNIGWLILVDNKE